jgi:hypothetical protein
MKETVYYARFPPGFEAVPAENYVDSMVNVMQVPERYIFYFTSRGSEIICEVGIESGRDRNLRWSMRGLDDPPYDALSFQLGSELIDELLMRLRGAAASTFCKQCDEILASIVELF